MALKTLREVKEIDGFPIYEIKKPNMSYTEYQKRVKGKYIVHDLKHGRLTFKIQDGPIKEKGVNGCQVDTMIKASYLIVSGLQKEFPCKQNEKALEHLAKALDALKDRKKDRVKRGVEGKSKK